MATLTGTDAELIARCAASGWMRWAHSSWDGLAHAFPAEESQRGRWLRTVCSATAPPAALGPATVIGPRCPRCPRCVLAVAAAGTTRHRRDQPGVCARQVTRLLTWRRHHRHNPQSPPSAQVWDVTLPPTMVEPAGHGHAVRALGTAGSGTTAPGGLVPSSPVPYHPRAAR